MWFDLKGDARLGRCATEGCCGQPTSRLEADGVGSNYCSGCRAKIAAPKLVITDEMVRAACNAHGASIGGCEWYWMYDALTAALGGLGQSTTTEK